MRPLGDILACIDVLVLMLGALGQGRRSLALLAALRQLLLFLLSFNGHRHRLLFLIGQGLR